MICPNCNNQVKKNPAFCPHCGADLSAYKTQSPAQVSTAKKALNLVYKIAVLALLIIIATGAILLFFDNMKQAEQDRYADAYMGTYTGSVRDSVSGDMLTVTLELKKNNLFLIAFGTEQEIGESASTDFRVILLLSRISGNYYIEAGEDKDIILFEYITAIPYFFSSDNHGYLTKTFLDTGNISDPNTIFVTFSSVALKITLEKKV
jgi:hypothetical protein